MVQQIYHVIVSVDRPYRDINAIVFVGKLPIVFKNIAYMDCSAAGALSARERKET